MCCPVSLFHAARFFISSLWVEKKTRERDVNGGDSKPDGGLFMEDANALV